MIKNKVLGFVSKIPRGKVVTYGQVARVCGTGPRVVGNILHRNTDPIKFPCHRVVNRDGRIASVYAFGGPEIKKGKLLSEGVVFIGDKVDLSRSQWFL